MSSLSYRFGTMRASARSAALFSLLCLLGTSLVSRAQTGTATWEIAGGGGANWTRPQNWVNNTAPVAGNALVFTGANKLANNNDFTAGTGFWSITFASGSGAFSLTGNAISLTNGITNNSASTQTIGLAGVSLGASQTFNAASGNLVFSNITAINLGASTLTIAGASNTVINGVISNTGSIVKSGAGTLILSGANTYTGGTTINAGTLSLGAANRLADTGAVTVSGGTFNLGGFTETVGAVSLTSGTITNGTLTGSSYAVQAGTIAAVLAGGGNLTKTGTGTVSLAAANTYTGTNSINGGVLSLDNAGSLGGNGSISFGGGTLRYSSLNTADLSARFLGTASAISIDTGGQNVTFASAIGAGQTGGLSKSGAGTLTLSVSNSYSGTTTLSAGTLRAANTSALGAAVAGDALTLNGGRLELASDANAIFGPGTGYGTTIGANTTIAVDRVTSGAATSLQLGTLSIGGQTLTVERGANATSGTAVLVIGGATTLTGNATFATAANTELRFTNTLAGVFNITKTGDGILTLNRGGGQANNTITAGQLNINHFQALGTAAGTLSLAGGVTIDNTSGASVSVGNAKSISLGSTLTFLGSSSLNLGNGTTTLTNNTAINVAANTLTLGGDVTGSAFGLTKNGAGTLELAGLTGTSSFTGNSFINAGELFLNGTSVFGGTSNTIVTVETNAFLRVGASAGLGNVSLVLNNPDGLILANIITNDVVFSNSGTISSTFANVDGSITIGEGVTMSTAANNLGTIPTTNTPGRIVLDNNATLAFTAGFTINQNQGILLQPGTATFSPAAGQAVFIASSITGDGELRKTGGGNIRLTGSNSYTGGTLIEQGIIGITSDSSLGAVSGRVKLNNGTLVAAQNNTGGPANTGTTVNAARTLVLGNGTTNNIDAQTELFFEYNGVIGEENVAGAASAMRFGIAGTREGTVRLGGLNTYDGATTIVAGTLEISNIANGGSSSGIGQSGNAATNLIIGGTLRYTGANGTTDRLFSIGSSGAATIDSGNGSLAFTNSGTLGYADPGITRHDLTLTGTGSGTMALALVNDSQNDPLHLTKIGSGTWTLLGANTYSGETVISAGTLQVGNGGTAGALGSGEVINNATLLFNRSDNATVNNTISGSGLVTKEGAGTLILTGNNSYAGGFFLNGNGAVRAQGASAFGSGFVQQASGSSKIIIDTTGTITNQMDIWNVSVLQSVTLSGAKTLNNATYDITNNTTTTESGALTGEGGITKLGTGTLLVTGDNSFEGDVDVQAGVLELASTIGSAAGGTTSVSVSSGATLIISQSGQVNDAATVSLSGGTITRGGGVSEVFGNLSLSSASTLDFGTGATGTLSFGTYTPSSLLTVNNFLPGNVLTFGSDLTSTINNGSLFSFDGGFTSSWSSGTSTFTITAIPEPSTYLAAAGLLALMLWPSRRRLLRDAQKILGLRAPMRDRLAAQRES